MTKGIILCEHVKALDLNARLNRIVEQIPKDLLEKAIDVVFSETEIPQES